MNTATKQRVRIEFDIQEHDYQVMNLEEVGLGDSYAYNGDEGIMNLEVYVDDELLDDEITEDYNSKYTDYVKVNLNWDNEDEEPAYFGYMFSEQHHIYEFETEKFDFNKLICQFNCYDVVYEDADYSAEEHHVSVFYDGVELENCQEPNPEGDWELLWSRYDDDDDSYEED
jgi:hypothetical protein